MDVDIDNGTKLGAKYNELAIKITFFFSRASSQALCLVPSLSLHHEDESHLCANRLWLIPY
jgi:hypothetical protein